MVQFSNPYMSCSQYPDVRCTVNSIKATKQLCTCKRSKQ